MSVIQAAVPHAWPGLKGDCWVILLVLFITRTTIAFQFQSVAALGPVLIPSLGIDFALLGTLIGIYMLPGIAFALPGGVLGQRFGDKRIALLGLALMVLGGAWIGFSESYASALVGRLLSGIGAVLLNVLLTKMLADWFVGREMALAMGLLLTSWPIGLGLALVLLGYVAATTSISVALCLSAVLSAVALALVGALYRAPEGLPPGTASFRIRLSRREWLLAITSGLIWTFYNVGYILVLAFGPSFLTARGYSVSEAGALVSLTAWVVVPVVAFGGHVAERFRRPGATMALCFLGSAAAICAVPLSAPPAVAFVLVALLFGPPAGLIMRLPAEALTPENRAVGMGVYYTCYYIGMAVLPPAAGLLRDMTASASAPLFLAAGSMIAAAVLLIVFQVVQRRRPQQA